LESTPSRRYPARPILGVGALIFHGDSILLVERGNEPLKGFWSLPGGCVEVGEKLDEALRREVLEETGLNVRDAKVFEIFERIIRDDEGRPEYHYVLVDYVCRVQEGAAEAASDVSGVAWVSRDELGRYRLTDGTIDVIQRAFDGYAGNQR
jgi:8-oxo-dGTP diphosphatase